VSSTAHSMSPGATLRALIAGSPGPVPIPGGGTPLEARSVETAGFNAFYVSGYAVAAWRHGVPDVGLIAMAEIVEAVSVITRATTLPVMVDADTGYGDVANVARTVRSLEHAGAAAIQIEDQAWPKKCGHMEGKKVISSDEMARKVRAAVRAREDDNTMIVARTDARAPLGLQEALDRGKRFADEGADMIFIDAPQSIDEMQTIGDTLPGHLVINMSESGKTPILPLDQLGSMGFKIVLYPTSALRLSVGNFSRMFSELHGTGSTAPWIDQMMPLDDLNVLLGIDELAALEDEVE